MNNSFQVRTSKGFFTDDIYIVNEKGKDINNVNGKLTLYLENGDKKEKSFFQAKWSVGEWITIPLNSDERVNKLEKIDLYVKSDEGNGKWQIEYN